MGAALQKRLTEIHRFHKLSLLGADPLGFLEVEEGGLVLLVVAEGGGDHPQEQRMGGIGAGAKLRVELAGEEKRVTGQFD